MKAVVERWGYEYEHSGTDPFTFTAADGVPIKGLISPP